MKHIRRNQETERGLQRQKHIPGRNIRQAAPILHMLKAISYAPWL